MRLTNKAREELRYCLKHMERAQTYIDDDRVAVCRRRDMVTTTLDYSRSDGAVLQEVATAVGSDLCGLDMAIVKLASFITHH